jgi:hypothetical protein
VALLNGRGWSTASEKAENSAARPIPPSSRGKSRLLILLVLLSPPWVWRPAEAQSVPLSEYQIKAGFLFNFTKFVEWPPDSFSDPGVPLVMGVVGDNQITSLLEETAAGKTVNGRAVIVKRFKEGQDIHGCQILFISSSEEKHTTQILERIKGSSILTVGETDGFVQSGGVINFFVEGNKVRLEVNLDAAARARLKISAKVIAVARLVKVDSPPGGRG